VVLNAIFVYATHSVKPKLVMLCKQKVQLSCAEITMILINDIYQNWVSFFHPSNLKLQRHACVPK